MSSLPHIEQEHKFWRYAFVVIGALIFILMPLMSGSYGQTGDEWLQMEYGEHVWNYFFNGDKQALDYTNKQLQYRHQELYGGLFDFPAYAVHRMFPSADFLAIRHFINAIYGALMMLFTGLFAKRVSGKWSVGVVALLFIIFSPRVFGESMNNPKDIPFAAGFIMGAYFFIAILQDFPRNNIRNLIGLALGWGIAFGVRSAGGVLLIAYMVVFGGLYYFLHKDFREKLAADGNKLLKKFLLFVGIALVAGFALGIAFWPWGLQSPISHTLEALQGMTNREAYLRVLYNGMYYMSNEMPAEYEFRWISISNPMVVIIGFVLFFALFIPLRKRYGNYVFIILAFAALFPLLYMIYKNSTVYDSWRHVFFVYPFWVVAAALGWDTLSVFIKNEKLKPAPLAIAILGLLPVVFWVVKNHPNETTYFNKFVGGPAGAHGYYDLDYYQNSGKQAADWVNENAKQPAGRKTVVYSNMSGIWHYFKDTSRIKSDYKRYDARHDLPWDYYITYTRYISPYLLQNDLWPPKNAIHQIKVDGKPICVVYARKCPDAHFDLANKNYTAAVQKFEACIKSGDTDADLYYGYAKALIGLERAAEGLTALAQAIKIEPDNMVYLDFQARLYHALQDVEGLNRTNAQMQQVMSRDGQYEAANGNY